MSVLRLENAELRFVGPPLLEGATLAINPGERVCLLGRNGCGKTSLLRVIAGEQELDAGEMITPPNFKVGFLQQDVPDDLQGEVLEFVSQGLPADARAPHEVISKMSLDPTCRVETLSAGMKRRVLLARALAKEPHLLLLDEPTNHLDLAAIVWLEKFLTQIDCPLLFVTHDRAFLGKLATRIIELDRAKFLSFECNYATYLTRREAMRVAETKQNALFDKKLAEEEKWIRKGILARRTRNEGRVRSLIAMRRERSDRREETGRARISLQSAAPSGRIVAKVKEVAFTYPGNTEPTINRFSTLVTRGDRIGIIGPNGCGKTTLLRVLLGEMDPTQGSVEHGTQLQVIYFDQLHAQIDLNVSVLDNVSNGNSTVQVGGCGKPKHILGYLQDFLFTPDRARSPAKQLSGGERNRLLLARLFTKPSNVIVLDEPTNDLDADTLDLLEEQLLEYDGTVLIVSHDRTFLNNVVTSTLAFDEESPGLVREYAGGYDDYLTQVQNRKSKKVNQEKAATKKSQKKVSESPKKKKLTYSEELELAAIPDKIVEIENSIGSLHEIMGTPGFYDKSHEEVAEVVAKLDELDALMEKTMSRWEELEE